MTLTVALQMDPVETININADSSFVLGLEALRRGHELHHYLPRCIDFAGGDVDGGNLGLESDGTLTYNPSTGKVTATGFVGTLTGDVTGDVTGTASGNASIGLSVAMAIAL